jgi:hypothetical protein
MVLGLCHASVLESVRNAARVPSYGAAVLQSRSDRCISQID